MKEVVVKDAELHFVMFVEVAVVALLRNGSVLVNLIILTSGLGTYLYKCQYC